MVAYKNEFKRDEPKKTHGKGKGLKPHESVKEFVRKFDKNKYFEKEEITSKGTYGKDLEKIPPGKNYLALTERAGIKNPKFKYGKRFWSFLLKLSPDKPSWTITAQPGPWVGPFHWNNRRLRVPEIAAIQTFPESYKFYGSRMSIKKQKGKAVQPILGKKMVEFQKANL